MLTPRAVEPIDGDLDTTAGHPSPCLRFPNPRRWLLGSWDVAPSGLPAILAMFASDTDAHHAMAERSQGRDVAALVYERDLLSRCFRIPLLQARASPPGANAKQKAPRGVRPRVLRCNSSRASCPSLRLAGLRAHAARASRPRLRAAAAADTVSDVCVGVQCWACVLHIMYARQMQVGGDARSTPGGPATAGTRHTRA